MSLFVLACMLLIFLAVEVRLTDVQKSIQELKDSFQKSMDKIASLEKNISSQK